MQCDQNVERRIDRRLDGPSCKIEGRAPRGGGYLVTYSDQLGPKFYAVNMSGTVCDELEIIVSGESQIPFAAAHVGDFNRPFRG